MLARVVCALMALTGAPPLHAQTAPAYPARPVTIVVPTAPGGSMDATARIIADKLSIKWGKPVIVENRAGAAMRIGATTVAKAPPDGYTLLLAHDGTMAMNAVVYQNLAYDPQKDFEPLSLVATVAEVVIVNNKVPAASLEELLRLARAAPGKLNHASGGTATLLSLEYLNSAAGVDIRDVPYKGGAPAVAAVIAGDVDLCIADIATARAAFGSDRVRLLAVTSLRRQKFASQLPTVDASGAPGYEVNSWLGVFAPAHTPRDMLAKLEGDIREVAAMPDVRSRLEGIGMEVRAGTADDLRQIQAADIAKWSALVKKAGIKMEQQ
jgi:tripartite-type tricarboxylate transporter receptor subunit TctC